MSCRAGSIIKIPATFNGRPTPKVSWEFEGGAKTETKDRLHVLPVDSEVQGFGPLKLKAFTCHENILSAIIGASVAKNLRTLF